MSLAIEKSFLSRDFVISGPILMRFSTFNSSKHCTPVVVDAGVNLQVTCSPSSLSPFPANLPVVPLFTSGGLGLVIDCATLKSLD